MAATAVSELPRLRNEAFSSALVEGKPPHWPIPESGDALPLVASDFDDAARQLGVEVAVVRAVALTESSGAGFDSKKRPKLRYENHHFRTLTNRYYDKIHPDLSNKYKSAQYRATHKGGADKQWELLQKCWAIDEADAGVMACSWGMFQVMGEYYKDLGWTSLEQFVKDMFYSEAQHMRAFLAFLKWKDLVRHLKKSPPDFTSFAIGYNGAGTQGYDTKMKNYYDQFKAR
jgi:hypothetical protein